MTLLVPKKWSKMAVDFPAVQWSIYSTYQLSSAVISEASSRDKPLSGLLWANHGAALRCIASPTAPLCTWNKHAHVERCCIRSVCSSVRHRGETGASSSVIYKKCLSFISFYMTYSGSSVNVESSQQWIKYPWNAFTASLAFWND